MRLIITEKPSVARDLAAALQIPPRGRSYFEGKDTLISWAIGHLVTLAEPHQINPAWHKWQESQLPMLPAHWPLVVVEETAEQFAVLQQLMQSERVHELIAATDAGREGELIFRYIYEKAGCQKPVQRLWLSSLTPESIALAFKNLRPLAAFDRLADNARGRSRADWLVGLNLSRAYTLQQQQPLTVGRVQTPTLALVVERTEAIENFVPEKYCEIEGSFKASDSGPYKGLYCEREKGAKAFDVRRFKPGEPALAQILEDSQKAQARLIKREDKELKTPPPKLYDLTELQKDANRLFAYQAKQTLDLAQKLYEQHKLITYPRSDSRYLSSSVAKGLASIVEAIEGPFRQLGLAPDTGSRPLGRAFVDDSKVGDHHAIIPTGKKPQRLSADEERIFDLIARRLLMAWQPDFVSSQCTLLTGLEPTAEAAARGSQFLHHFRSTGSSVLTLGWKLLELRPQRDKTPLALPSLGPGAPVAIEGIRPLDKETRPPPALNDAALLNAMASAGSRLDDKELTDILRERGLGTPATRAAIIENLVQRGYVERREKTLWATERGKGLIALVDPQVRSAALTGEWEAKLQRIEAGELSLDVFMEDIASFVKSIIQSMRQNRDRVPRLAAAETRGSQAREQDRAGAMAAGASTVALRADSALSQGISRSGAFSAATLPLPPSLPRSAPDPAPCSLSLEETLAKVFGHQSFREHQEQICREIIAGHDLLLVMPTGAGKSLCYQLPALMRPGAALVISPLIALMDDQVGKLRALGVPAGALHSGMSREDSRAIFRSYLSGQLKLLYVAPERLGLSGFLDLLAQHPPSLIAVDEAHCISQWGHDFRPEYRMLVQRLPRLRPAPIVAMTATATPEVQRDILEQLGLKEPKLHIHGFRRKNIAIEISEVPIPDRPRLVQEILRTKERLPAIVYAPTRKETEELAATFSGSLRAAAYHAGLTPERRLQVQTHFIDGRLDVIVATIAFGMGIDKSNIRSVIHTALPSSVEAYYQEIGRAGRDGKMSRAILLYSFADHKTRQFFVRKNYPDISLLESVLRKIPETGIDRSAIPWVDEIGVLDNALEKLWVHGAIEIESDDQVKRRLASWQKTYAAQKAHKEEEVKLIGQFAESRQHCRMLQFLQHFGDQSADRSPCGICDICSPLASLSKEFRSASCEEQDCMQAILSTLPEFPRRSSLKKVQEASFSQLGSEDRRTFERCLAALIREGLVEVSVETFTKENRTIEYRAVGLATREAARADCSEIAVQELRGEARTSRQGARAGRSASQTKKGVARAKEKKKSEKQKGQQSAAGAQLDTPLAQQLRGWRLRQAKSERIPAFRVFSDKTLAALAQFHPTHEGELKEIEGIGPVKLERYGHEILKILKEFMGAQSKSR